MDSDHEPQLYELAFILPPSIPEDAVAVEVTKITSILEGHGASIVISENPRLRGLAYTIERSSGGKREKFDQGYFGWTKFNILAENIPAIKTDLTHINTIIRDLLIHAKPGTTSTTARRIPRHISISITPDMPIQKVSEAEIDKEVEKLIESASVAV
ncbi:MAG: 30S ribosomal protein S6 [Patescibacteria group bacterium]